MPELRVEFSKVKFSDIENTHYFHDPASPDTIQFLLNGVWEPYHFDFVKRNTEDPELRRLAETVEAELPADHVPAYRPPPEQIPEPPANGPASPTPPPPPRSRTPPSPMQVSPAISEFPDLVLASPAPTDGDSLFVPDFRTPSISQDETTQPRTPQPQTPRPANSRYAPQRGPPRPPTSAEYQFNGHTQAPPYGYGDMRPPQTPFGHPPNHPSQAPYGHPPPAPSQHPYAYPEGGQPPPGPYGYPEDGHRPQTPYGYQAGGPRGQTPFGYREASAPPQTPYSASAELAFVPEYNNRRPPPVPTWSPALNKDAKLTLALDGDGVRGLSSILLIESLVNAICVRIDQRMDPYEIFDMIAGVSTMGLIATMIGRLRMRVHEAREAYMGIARSIFIDKWKFFVTHDPHVMLPPIHEPTLEETVSEMVMKQSGNLSEPFFDGRDGATNVFLISTKVEIGQNQAAIIRTYPTRRTAGPEVPSTITTHAAIMATLKAPAYVEPSTAANGHPYAPPIRRAVIAPGMVDHGIAKNNPTKDLYYECRKLYSYANDIMVIISIGTGGNNGAPSAEQRMTESLSHPDDVKEMVRSVAERSAEATLAGEKFESDQRRLIEGDPPWMRYFRFEVPGLADLPLEEGLCVEEIMDRTTAYLAQEEVGRKFYAAVEAVVGVLVGKGTVHSPEGGWAVGS